MSAGKLVKLALTAAVIIIAVTIVGTIVLTLIYPDLPERINDAGVRDTLLLHGRQVLTVPGTAHNAPTPLPGINNTSICSPASGTIIAEVDPFEVQGPELKADGSDIAIESINISHENLSVEE